MSYQVVVPKGSAPPLAPYSPGTKAGNTVYVSGTLALDSSGNLVGKGDARAQTRQILDSIKAVLEAAGGSLKGRDVQSYLPLGHEPLCRDERGLSRIFPGRSSGPLLHTRRPGKT